MSTSPTSGAWHRAWFDEDYLRLYQHRDSCEASGLLGSLRAGGLLPDPPAAGPVLDLGCGAGRHSLELSRLGYHVVGLDWSPVLLRAARKASPSAGARPVLVRGDLGRLPLRGGAGVVLSLFTSLGYLEDDGANGAVWARLLSLVRPGGRVLLDFLNPAYLRATLVRESERPVGDWVVREERRLDESRNMVVKTMRFGPPGTVPREVREQVKLYEPDWFLAPAFAAGFRLLAHWGDLRGNAMSPGSPRSLLALEKPA